MNSIAPGQFLGYTLQLPRALYHLLKSGPGDKVSIEVLSDVATSKLNGSVISEEDKSSIIGNPITDRSTDLWKTFSNWIDAINSGVLNVKKTKFILYCNQTGRLGIVNKFSDAKNHKEIKTAIDYAKTELNDIKPNHNIWKYYNFVINENQTLFLEIVERFELELGNGAGYDDLRYEIKRIQFPESQIEFILDVLSGWVQKVVVEKIKAKEKAIIRWEDFNHQFLVLFERARHRDLIDFSLEYPPKVKEIQNQVKIHPTYLRQLDVIASSDGILEAVYEYLRANINRTKWIDNEIIDEDIASDFELRLREFWKNQRKRIQITQKTLSEEEQGQLLYGDCKSRTETIKDINPPYPTIAGTYHALADEPVLGWHPNWENLFPCRKEN